MGTHNLHFFFGVISPISSISLGLKTFIFPWFLGGPKVHFLAEVSFQESLHGSLGQLSPRQEVGQVGDHRREVEKKKQLRSSEFGSSIPLKMKNQYPLKTNISFSPEN